MAGDVQPGAGIANRVLFVAFLPAEAAGPAAAEAPHRVAVSGAEG